MLVIKVKQPNFYNKGISIINFGKLFLNFIIDTLNWFLNGVSLLQQGLLKPELYDDLVYKFRKTVGEIELFEQFKKNQAI